MKKEKLIMWFVCFLLRKAHSQGLVCTDVPEAWIVKFCQTYTITSAIVYLDSSGFPIGQIGECACNVSNVSGTRVNITSVPFSRPGKFKLVVDRTTVQTPVVVPFKSVMQIVLRRPSNESIRQCLEITGALDGGSSSSPMQVACGVMREISSDPPRNTGSTLFTDPGSSEKLAGGDTNGSGVSNIGIIAGAVVGGLAVVAIIAVVVILLLRRNRKARTTKNEPRECNQNGKDPEYDMTVNEGYVSADYVVNPRKDAQRSMETYEDITDAAAKSKTFSATDHDASGYAVVNKSITKKNNKRYDLDEETEYDSLTEKKVIQPTGNIYGVALPIQPKNSDA